MPWMLWIAVDEEADKGRLMTRTGEWVDVSSGTGSPGQSKTKGRKTVVVL